MFSIIGYLGRSWRRIGAKLYLALGFAVLLTLVSSGVGVYYFEQSGDASYRLRAVSYPAVDSSTRAEVLASELRGAALSSARADRVVGVVGDGGDVGDLLTGLDEALASPASAGELAELSSLMRADAYILAGLSDNAVLARGGLAEARAELSEVSNLLSGLFALGDPALGDPALGDPALGTGDGTGDIGGEGTDLGEGPGLVAGVLLAGGVEDVDRLWGLFLAVDDLDPVTADLGVRAYEARLLEFAALGRLAELEAELSPASLALGESSALLSGAALERGRGDLGATAASFDEGRVLLAAISVASVALATLAAWFLVGNGLVRPLSALSERMRGMASGDLETSVPGIGGGEIGELAHALEVFRAQAYEVQRLNLVERLYGELREAHDEMGRLQARLVAQEKLAGLGEIVSGVAHEISNPLNFVQNFAEVAVEMYEELTEVLVRYEGDMSDADRELLADLREDFSDNLQRIRSNGGRALAIVERMRVFGVAGGELVQVDLNACLKGAVDVALDSFQAQVPDLGLELEYGLDASGLEVPLVEHDFGEAVVNLVWNACHAMSERRGVAGEGYRPVLLVTTERAGDEAVIRIRDNGTGVPEALLTRIFNPFFTTRSGVLGAGLGLPIAADVVQRSGGSLTLDTVEGEYAEFIVALPLSVPESLLDSALDSALDSESGTGDQDGQAADDDDDYDDDDGSD